MVIAICMLVKRINNILVRTSNGFAELCSAEHSGHSTVPFFIGNNTAEHLHHLGLKPKTKHISLYILYSK